MMGDPEQLPAEELCFVCDELLKCGGIDLKNEKTVVSQTEFPNKISNLVGESYVVVISEDDRICVRCFSLINKLDEFEAMVLEVKDTLVTFIVNKYNLGEGEIDTPSDNMKETLDTEQETNLNNPSFQTKSLENLLLSTNTQESSKVDISTERELKKNFDNTVSDNELNQIEVFIKCETCSSDKSQSEHYNCCQHKQGEKSPTGHTEVTNNYAEDSNCAERKIELREVKIEHNDTDENNYEHHSCQPLEADLTKENLSVVGKDREVTKVESQHLDDTPLKKGSSNKNNQLKLARTNKFPRRNLKQRTNFMQKLRPILPKIENLNDLANVIEMDAQDKLLLEEIRSIETNNKMRSQVKRAPKRDTGLNDTTCKICRIDFETLEQLQTHEKAYPSSGNNLSCCHCGKIFKTFSGVRDHAVNRHSNKFAYYCDFCGRGFTTRARFEDHHSSHTHEGRWVCDVCGKRFNHQSTYWIHKKWHTEPLPYQCDVCGRKFKHTSLLAVHRRSHTGERPYKCTYCNLTFTSTSSCKRHTILHTREYPFHCHTCRVGFITRFKYTHHMAKAHGKVLSKQTVEKRDLKMAVYEEESPVKCQIVEDDQSSSTGSNYKFAYLEDSPVINAEHINDGVVEIILTPTESKSLLHDGLISEVWLE